MDNILENVLSEDRLNALILSTTSLNSYHFLFQIKKQRIVDGNSEKIKFPIHRIYSHKEDAVDLQITVLKQSFCVVDDCEENLVDGARFFMNQLTQLHDQDNLLWTLKLLHTLIDVAKCHNKDTIFFDSIDFNTLITSLLAIFESTYNSAINFILTQFIPSYLDLCKSDHKNVFLKKIFEFVCNSGNLTIICALSHQFIGENVTENCYNLIKEDGFWRLIIACLRTKNHFDQKQTLYLLSKATTVALGSNNLDLVPYFVKLRVSIPEAKRIWKNYLILFDVSNEKQLHLIQPSLQMLQSTQDLDVDFRICLYRVFLNHSQSYVVYFVATYILKNEEKWCDFCKIAQDLLSSINKSEFSTYSESTFKQMRIFVHQLQNENFTFLLETSLNISWTPAAIWCFYNAIFDNKNAFSLPIMLIENIINKLKAIPNVYIRNGCIEVVLSYCMKTFSCDKLEDCLRFCCLLMQCNISLLSSFVTNHSSAILIHVNEIRKELLEDYENYCVDRLEAKLVLLKMLKVNPLILNQKYSACTDIYYSVFFDHFQPKEIEEYICNRHKNIKINEDEERLLQLIARISTDNLNSTAIEILLNRNENKQVNKVHKVISLAILAAVKNINNYSSIQSFVSAEKMDERFSFYLVKIICESIRLDHPEIIEDQIYILHKFFDAQSESINYILKNISIFLKYAKSEIVLKFIDRCFEEFFNLDRISFKKVTNRFLAELFSVHNDILLEKQIKVGQKIMDLSIGTNNNNIIYILSQKINIFTMKHFSNPNLIPIITQLLLYGGVIQRNEKVDYYINQDITRTLMTKNNPNLEELGVRLEALSSMLNLAKTEEVADLFASSLLDNYMFNFNKRYFPDSQIHFQKLRIIQALLVLSPLIKTAKPKLLDFIAESFLQESHQPSVKHLMQWLFINLLKEDYVLAVEFISRKMKEMGNTRPSTVAGFIPVLYHLTLLQQECDWHKTVAILVPGMMGAQFKLRAFSQVALLKLYKKAEENNYQEFVKQYQFLYQSIQSVIELSANSLNTVVSSDDFLDYFSLNDCKCNTIYYIIPKRTGVSAIEWENIPEFANKKTYKHFDEISDLGPVPKNSFPEVLLNECSENVQKKITPWKDALEDADPNNDNNDFMLVTSLVEKATNLGGLARSCEVFGVKQLVMKTAKITSDKEFKSLSMSSESWLNITEVKIEDLKIFLIEVKSKGYRIIGAEQTSQSVNLHQYKFHKKTVLLLGNEKEGISPDLIPLLDDCIEIPQFGMVRSLNVHVAGAIVIWEYCKQHSL